VFLQVQPRPVDLFCAKKVKWRIITQTCALSGS